MAKARGLVPTIACGLLLLRCLSYGEDEVENRPAPAVVDAGKDSANITTADGSVPVVNEPEPEVPVEAGCLEGPLLETVDDQLWTRGWNKFEADGGVVSVDNESSAFPPSSLSAIGSSDSKTRAYGRRNICPIRGGVQCEFDLRIDKVGYSEIAILDVLAVGTAYVRIKTNSLQFKEPSADSGLVPKTIPLNLRTLPIGVFHHIKFVVTHDGVEVTSPLDSVKLPVDGKNFDARDVRWGLIFKSGDIGTEGTAWEIHVDELRCAFGLAN